MIHALTHGNTGLKIKEDTLTAFVLGQMLFLPDNLIWKIFREACFDKSLPEYVGKLEAFEFWAYWNMEGSNSYVEPDVFIRFEKIDIIVEAKRYDTNQQNPNQWKREFIGYRNEYSEEERKVIMFAIGGIHKEETETITIPKDKGNSESISAEVFKFKWQNILNEIIRIKEKLEVSEGLFENASALVRTTNSVIKAFEMHGYFTGQWLDSLPNQYLISSDNNITNWKIKYVLYEQMLISLPSYYKISNHYSSINQWNPHE